MERCVSVALAVVIAGAIAPRSAPAQSVTDRSCPETPMIRAMPPPTNNAGLLDDGPWWVNEDKTIWVRSIAGTRIDATAEPMVVRWVPQTQAAFQTMGLTFATEGCWKITATAGDRTLDFVTRVHLLPSR